MVKKIAPGENLDYSTAVQAKIEFIVRATMIRRAISRLSTQLPTSYRARLREEFSRVVSYLSYVRLLDNSFWTARGFLRHQEWRSDNKVKALANSASAKSLANTLNPLETYFDSHTEGRGIWKWRHYFEIYHRHFSKFVGQEVHVLEIGVYSGGSLGMWKHYFGPRCRIYGVDIEEACKSYAEDSVRIFVGDQADRNFWTRFKKEVPLLDIIVDDGGHAPHQQMVTLEEMLPHLRPGGVYLCEDLLRTQPNRFASYVNGLSLNLHICRLPAEFEGLSCLPTPFHNSVHSVHLYPFVAVIEKTGGEREQFIAPKHGTEWQPFFDND